MKLFVNILIKWFRKYELLDSKIKINEGEISREIVQLLILYKN